MTAVNLAIAARAASATLSMSPSSTRASMAVTLFSSELSASDDLFQRRLGLLRKKIKEKNAEAEEKMM